MRRTSTLHPNNCSRYCLSPDLFNRLGFMSTHTSTSLDSLCSLRAIEPKICIERTPYLDIISSLYGIILLIHSLLVIISVVCLTAANIRIIPEMAKEFEENIFFYSKRRAIIGVFSQWLLRNIQIVLRCKGLINLISWVVPVLCQSLFEGNWKAPVHRASGPLVWVLKCMNYRFVIHEMTRLVVPIFWT